MTVYKFFDKLEDRARGWFSRRPILYGFVGGIGIVLFWRGVWHTADWISSKILEWELDACGANTVSCGVFPDGPLSFIIGSVLLLATGLFVSGFIGNEIIISGLRGERKLTEKTETEVRTETGAIAEIKEELKKISARLDELRKKK
jgi:hypothetical protein